MNPGVNTLYHDIKARQAAREVATPKGTRAHVWAFIRRSWHNTMRWPTYRRTV